jgi:hypothetical protein
VGLTVECSLAGRQVVDSVEGACVRWARLVSCAKVCGWGEGTDDELFDIFDVGELVAFLLDFGGGHGERRGGSGK